MILDKVLQKVDEKKVSAQSTGKEKISRSIAKSVSWRIIGTLDTIFISWIVTGAISVALSIGFVELVTNMTLYVIHEIKKRCKVSEQK